MIVLSFNCRGLASQAKRLTLKELVHAHNPDIILLQETLGKGEEVVSVLSKLMPRWSFFALDAVGKSGGVVSGFNPVKLKYVSSWGSQNVLAVELFSSEFNRSLLSLNIYGPCLERERFWSAIFRSSWIAHPFLIIGGDLNFSLGEAESWGATAKADPLSEFFLNRIALAHLVDMPLLKLKPTWRNRRVGQEWVGKKLDRFLLSEPLV